MKRKIFLNGRFLTQPVTGVQRTAVELVKGLDALIEEKVINENEYEFVLIYSGELINHLELKFIRVCKKGILKGNLWEQLELPVYTAGHLLISMCTVSTLLKRKQMVIVHDASPIVNPQFFSFIFRLWYRIAVTVLGKVARQIITVSNFSKSELVSRIGIKEGKIEVIYNAADHILRIDDCEQSFKDRILALQPYCLAVSSLSANKNFKVISKAFNQTEFSGYRMLVAGGKSNTLNYDALDKGITSLGYVTNEQLKYLYTNASLFIFPSFYEGFGIPPLEAMICGCPVLASNASALPEVLEKSVEYFDPGNAEELAIKLHKIVKETQKIEDLRQKGLDQAQKYSWKKSALYLYKLIEKNNR